MIWMRDKIKGGKDEHVSKLNRIFMIDKSCCETASVQDPDPPGSFIILSQGSGCGPAPDPPLFHT